MDSKFETKAMERAEISIRIFKYLEQTKKPRCLWGIGMMYANSSAVHMRIKELIHLDLSLNERIS